MPELLMPFAVDPAGNLAAAADVPRGADCRCTCPECHQPVIAKQGDHYRWHFAHHATDHAAGANPCAGAPETQAHETAKRIILAASALQIPPTSARYGDTTHLVSDARMIPFTTATAEVWLGDIRRRPDAIVLTEHGPLAIEIWVAHRCQPDKLADFAARNLAAIEIDLTAYRKSLPTPQAVLATARRQWLHNPRQAELDAELAQQEQARVAERLAAEAAETAQRLAQQQETDRQWREWQAEANQRAVERSAQQAAADRPRLRRQAELQLAAAQSAVDLLTQHFSAIPDAAAALERATYARDLAAQRFAALDPATQS
jgi:hypothetical protein